MTTPKDACLPADTSDKALNFRRTTYMGVAQTKATFTRPLVIAVGKSNVGKSSLINALTGARHARVSQTPGQTTLIHLYNVDDAFILVDVPGYGYTATGRMIKRALSRATEAFVAAHEASVYLWLLDIRHAMTALDRHMGAYLAAQKAPVVAVLTKADKVSCRDAQAARARLMESPYGFMDVIAVSTTKRMGLNDLRQRLAAFWNLTPRATD